MSSLLLTRLSRHCLSKPPTLLGVKRYLSGARFLSETTPICRIVRADSSGDESFGRLVIRNVNASEEEEEEDEVLEKMVLMELMTGTGTIGASHGWVATLKDGVMCLKDDLNPRASGSYPKRISLPPFETLPHCQTKLVTNIAMSSSSPDDEDCILAVKFLGPQLSLRRPAQEKKERYARNKNEWVNFRIEDPGLFSSRVMYSKNEKMFSMVGRGVTHIGSWDLEKHRSHDLDYIRYKEFLKSEMEEMSKCRCSEHLVEAPTGERFIVKWYTDICPEEGFQCWKRFMVFRTAGGDVISTDDIDDLCIFLSTKGEPFCVDATLYGLTPNCIYYVGDFDYGKVNIRDNVRVGGYGFSPAPYFIPPQSS